MKDLTFLTNIFLQRSVCFHHYASNDVTHKRDSVPKFWVSLHSKLSHGIRSTKFLFVITFQKENSSKYAGIGKKSMARLLGIVKMNPEVDPSLWSHEEEEIYGVGKVRSTEKFYETFGIDVVSKKTHKNLCGFVETGKMHETFMPKLRADGMGVDYNLVKYKH